MIPGPALPTAQSPVGYAKGTAGPSVSAAVCGSASLPQLNPEALLAINSVQANNMGADGAGITVATIADGLNPANPDFQRNADFASASSPAGSPVVTQVDFTGDAATVPTPGGEMFLDASSIAAQGNQAYDLSQYVNTKHPLPAGCDIKIVGTAPGARVLALKVFSENNDTTTSNFLQAINYAVAHGVKVINESFGANNIPDLAADVIRQAEDAAVAAGVTVVASTGDAGITSTIGSPATDPHVIGVGATTTLRGYVQDTFGGINVPGASGHFINNNISSFSSAGVSQRGRTVDLVAPGDLNWALCDANVALYTDCTNDNGAGSPIQLTGGTSESSPLVAGAAADVIQAYASAHGGSDPAPALVKEILTSTATDINAPATQQGAGLVNVARAVELARSIGRPQRNGSVLVSPGQIDVTQKTGATATRAISVTNTSSHRVNVSLFTRQFTHQVADQSGTFCLQPGTATASCPANTGTLAVFNGITDVFQTENFTVPATDRPSRLDFAADYQFTGQSSVLHVALLAPDGSFAGYSDPQGLGDYASIQVANPEHGKWTAVFFTEQNGATKGAVGTSGPIQWDAKTVQAVTGGSVSPSSLSLAAGQTGSATLRLTSSSAGDTEQSVVVLSGDRQTTIPVAVRATVPTTAKGGTFAGVLTGGNGRGGAPAQANYYTFTVPKGARNIHGQINLGNDPGDVLTGYLISPTGQNLGYSSNVTADSRGNPVSTLSVDLYHARPAPGQWTIALQWANPVSGAELTEPFKGVIRFGQLPIHSKLPHSTWLKKGKTYTFNVTVHNTGRAPEDYFVDPRLHARVTLALPNQNPGANAASMTLPLPSNVKGGPPFPFYLVPTETSQISERLTGSAPVNFDSSYFPGDPAIEGTQSGHSASLTFSNSEISPGIWGLNPSEIGPYPASGAPAVTASAAFSAVTKAFDPAVTSSTGDLWSALEGLSATLAPVYVPAGGSATITVKIKAIGAVGSHHSGTLYVDDLTIAGFAGIFGDPNGDELLALPYNYRIAK